MNLRPYRDSYRHNTCETNTVMSFDLAESLARDPKFHVSVYCVHCRMFRPVGEFSWPDGSRVGS